MVCVTKQTKAAPDSPLTTMLTSWRTHEEHNYLIETDRRCILLLVIALSLRVDSWAPYIRLVQFALSEWWTILKITQLVTYVTKLLMACQLFLPIQQYFNFSKPFSSSKRAEKSFFPPACHSLSSLQRAAKLIWKQTVIIAAIGNMTGMEGGAVSTRGWEEQW